MFTDKEISYMLSLGLDVDFNDCSEHTLNEIMDVLGDRLVLYGFDENYSYTPEGVICDPIITKITAHPNW